MTKEIYRLLKSTHASGKTILFTSHRPEEIKTLATRVILLHQGSLVFDGPPQEYFQSKIHEKLLRMIRNIITLTLNDLAIAFKNKTIYLILFIPLFVFLSLKFVDQKDANFQKINIGLIQKEHYSPVIMKSIKAADNSICNFLAFQ